jgi:hypothetical protein
MSVPQLTQEEIDAGLEREIETARLAMMNAKDRDLARAGAAAMAMLIQQRSEAQISRMEARLPEPWRS